MKKQVEDRNWSLIKWSLRSYFHIPRRISLSLAQVSSLGFSVQVKSTVPGILIHNHIETC